MANKIAILNFKGGVGKTTTAVNLSAALVMAGKKVLLVDLDAQCDTTKTLRFSMSDGQTIYDAMMDKTFQTPLPVYHHHTGLDFVPSSIMMRDAAEVLISRMKRENILNALLKKIEKEYDYILIDCPTNYSVINDNAMCAAKYIIIPVDGGAYATGGMAHLKSYIDNAKNLLNDEIELLGIVFTKFEKNIRLFKHNLQEIEKVFSNQTFDTKIDKCIKINEAQQMKNTIYEYSRYCTAAVKYEMMAQEIITALE